MTRLRPASVAVGLLLAPVAAAAADPQALPPYTAAYEPKTVDERGMWMVADEVERQIKQSSLLINDEALNSYVRRVLCDTVGSDRCASARIYVLESPHLNASMMPNGTMTVNTGLLLRARSEAELGAVLGHEFGHFELRHSLAGFKNQRGSTDAMAWLSAFSGLTNTSTYSTQYSILGSMFSYQRSQEEAADLIGLQYLGSSKYPSAAAADVWTGIMAEADATAAGRKLKKRHSYSAGFAASHPTDLKRATTLAAAAAKIGDAGDRGVESHYAAIKPYLPRMLAAQVKLNDFGGSEYLMGEMARGNGWTPELLFARGELYQLRGNPRDFVSASQFYKEAIAQGCTEPTAYRNLGITLLKSGWPSEARPQLEEYLRRLPDASDAGVIKTLIAQ